jgi:hypothetical protein
LNWCVKIAIARDDARKLGGDVVFVTADVDLLKAASAEDFVVENPQTH